MKIPHDIPLLNICGPATLRRLNERFMAELSRLVLRAKMPTRATCARAVNIQSKLSQLYAMARPSLCNLSTFDNKSTTARVGARDIGQVRLAGLNI